MGPERGAESLTAGNWTEVPRDVLGTVCADWERRGEGRALASLMAAVLEADCLLGRAGGR